MFKILYIARDDGGCGYFRCRQPAEFIRRLGLADTEVTMKVASPEKLLLANLVIFQEMGSVESMNMAQFCIQNSIPYLAEIDDFLHHISPHNISGYTAWNPGTLYLSRSMTLLQMAQGATVSTNQLAREYFPYNENIYIVPNYLNKEKWDNPIIKNSDGKIRIGWCGGNAHTDDLKMISQVIEKIVKEYKDKVMFETFGMLKPELAGVFPLHDFNADCPACGYQGEIRYYPGEPLENYPLALSSKGWDIAVAPVINNAFGNCKSDLKIKEYASTGIPVVASPIIPYLESVKNGAQICFAETFKEWYNNIKDLIDNPRKRDEIIRHNREWINQYWIQDNPNKIFEVYSQVISRFEPLREQKNKQKKL